MRPKCEICGDKLVEPSGPINAKILLVGEFPGHEEQISGHPFVGKVGEILRNESIIAGLDLTMCRITNLWQHVKNEKGCDIEWHLKMMSKEFKNKKFVLLMGSDLTKVLFKKGVMELSGLEVPSDLFPKQRIFVSPNPAQLLHGPLGEWRLSLKR